MVINNRNNFRVIIGGAEQPGPDEDRIFKSAYVTGSRLMGVLVVYLCWRLMPTDKKQKPETLHQFFYIETGDIGIETYVGIRGNNAKTIFDTEQSMLGGLGSDKVAISRDEAVLILRKYAEVNAKNGEPLPDEYSEYGFIFNDTERDVMVSGDRQAARQAMWDELFPKLCAGLNSDNELINYFLMRYFAGDSDAVRYLTCFDLPADMSPARYDETLCLNRITTHESGSGQLTYICESLIEHEDEHRIIVTELGISDGRISSLDVISDFQITGVETAMKLERPEFVTVFAVLMDPEDLIDYLDERYVASMKRDTGAGRLYLRFHPDNSHMGSNVYRLNDDVSGIIYVTDEAQLIIAAYSTAQIGKLEAELKSWPCAKKLQTVSKYEFKEGILYDFLGTDSGDFIQYVDLLCDLDPDDDGK